MMQKFSLNPAELRTQITRIQENIQVIHDRSNNLENILKDVSAFILVTTQIMSLVEQQAKHVHTYAENIEKLQTKEQALVTITQEKLEIELLKVKVNVTTSTSVEPTKHDNELIKISQSKNPADYNYQIDLLTKECNQIKKNMSLTATEISDNMKKFIQETHAFANYYKKKNTGDLESFHNNIADVITKLNQKIKSTY